MKHKFDIFLQINGGKPTIADESPLQVTGEINYEHASGEPHSDHYDTGFMTVSINEVYFYGSKLETTAHNARIEKALSEIAWEIIELCEAE